MKLSEKLAIKYAAEFTPAIPPPPLPIEELEEEVPEELNTKVPRFSAEEERAIERLEHVLEREEKAKKLNQSGLDASLREIELLKELLDIPEKNEKKTRPPEKKAHYELIASKYCLNDSSR